MTKLKSYKFQHSLKYLSYFQILMGFEHPTKKFILVLFYCKETMAKDFGATYLLENGL